MVSFVDHVGCRFVLFGGDIIQGVYHSGIKFPRIVHKGARNGMYLLCPKWVKVRQISVGTRVLDFGAIGWEVPVIWGILRLLGLQILKLVECFGNIARHRDIKIFFIGIPI